MKRFIIGFGWLVAACVAVAGTGTSNEFRVDTRTGVRTAAGTEKIQYSTAWATNLFADAQERVPPENARAVVKVNPCLKTPPKYLVVDMSGGRSAVRWPISYLDEVPSGGWTDEYKTEKLVLRYIPAGSFIMGGRATDYPGAVNTNLHMVTLTKPFYIGVFECTQRQWELAMGTRPSAFSNETCYATRPVESIKFTDVRGLNDGLQWPNHSMVDEGSFMEVIRRKTIRSGFDLPTSAQWEYACRAGTTSGLNSGKNVTHPTNCANVAELARYWMNSGASEAGFGANFDKIKAQITPRTTEVGTASVGSYIPNSWGLYDMHGNVYEFVLDVYSTTQGGCIDPKGAAVGTSTSRIIRGASFSYPDMKWLVSGGVPRAYGQASSGAWTLGFRCCLHDAVLEDGTEIELVNASGSAAADWTPTQVGTYQLTHEVQMDGVTVAPMESALFKVEGPALEIVPMGDLTNGVPVEVKVKGAIERSEIAEGLREQWTVYYSLDGTTPTAGSTRYEGPFALPDSATVKAVAISAGGVSSEVASKELALHPALAVEDTAARQRWPWNGKVDIDCEVTGDPAKKYRVSFAVSDEVGGTNLPINCVINDAAPDVTNREFIVKPGKYRFTWDAAADLPRGTKYGGVAVSVDAVEWIVRNLRVVSSRGVNSELELSWDALSGAVTYVVFRKDGDKELVKIGESNESRFCDGVLDETMLCQYGVAGLSENGFQGPICPLVGVLRQSTVAADGLEAYYPFDEDGYDYSGHERDFEKEDGGLVATSWIDDVPIHFPVDDWCDDRIGRNRLAFGFRGTNHLHSVDGWAVTNNLSIVCWIKSRKPIVIPTTSESATYAIFPVHGGDDDVDGIGFAAGTDGLAVCEHRGQYLKSSTTIPCLNLLGPSDPPCCAHW